MLILCHNLNFIRATIFGIRGTFQGWVDESITAYTVSQSSGRYEYEVDNPGGDSSNTYYTHRYITTQKQLTGWSNINITLSNHNIPNGSRVAAYAYVDIKVINGGLAWNTQMYPNHDTWNGWRDCWYHIGRIGKFRSSYSMATSYTFSIPSGYNICYALDVWSRHSSWFWGYDCTVTVKFTK